MWQVLKIQGIRKSSRFRNWRDGFGSKIHRYCQFKMEVKRSFGGQEKVKKRVKSSRFLKGWIAFRFRGLLNLGIISKPVILPSDWDPSIAVLDLSAIARWWELAQRDSVLLEACYFCWASETIVSNFIMKLAVELLIHIWTEQKTSYTHAVCSFLEPWHIQLDCLVSFVEGN